MDMVMDNINRWKILGSILSKDNKDTYIKKINGDLHFCKIVLINKDYILVKNFGPEQRAGLTQKIYWIQVSEFDEFDESKRF